MCLITFAINCHPDYSLILAGNRDEFYDRPTTYAHYWEDIPHLLAGRDLQGGGTWLGISKTGRLAAVTNYRDPQNMRADARTRGDLTTAFLKDDDLSAREYLSGLHEKADEYNGFNLLLFDGEKAFHYSNYEKSINELPAGVYGLSNALLDTPWPKLVRLKKSFEDAFSQQVAHEDLLAILEDSELAADHDLPDTGIPYEWEKAISSICIQTDNYGTCCSTVVTIDKRGQASFTERSFPVGARENKVVQFSFDLPKVEAGKL